MCINLERAKGKVEDSEWLFLVTGGATLTVGGKSANPAPDWLSESAWNQLQLLGSLPAFKVRKFSFITGRLNFI